MNKHWQTLAERTEGLATNEEIEAALYRLVTEQVLYYSDRKSKRDYQIIAGFERDLKGALSALGIDLHVERALRYACALPRYAKPGSIHTGQTIFALLLRQIYDEAMRQGKDISESGEVVCDLVELEEKYRLLTTRAFPSSKNELREMLRAAKRWGIARISDGSGEDIPETALQGQDFVIIIRPAITVILGEAAISRISALACTVGLPEEVDPDAENADNTLPAPPVPNNTP
ncbi:DUF4194 domain-containing protein [Undibacterium sp. Tian12W]|uniref:DUF4194 domain-containing protein n=1 Tax=Undibacterium sp. Tian12W TaxID=3413054 RepID=UPI003BEFF683